VDELIKSINNNYLTSSLDGILREGDECNFKSSILFFKHQPGVPPEDNNPKKFNEIVDFLQCQGFNTIGFILRFSYQNIFEEVVECRVLADGWKDMNNECTLKDLVMNSEHRKIMHISSSQLNDDKYIAVNKKFE